MSNPSQKPEPAPQNLPEYSRAPEAETSHVASVPSPPVSQASRPFRRNWPEWAKYLPRMRFPPQNMVFQLISPSQLQEVLRDADPETVVRIQEDMKVLEYELLRFFRERDYEASRQQNRYRLYQISFAVLATVAAALAVLMALAWQVQSALVSVLAFAITTVALIGTFVATISGREPPFPLWMENRRRAEGLRREYFRYLLNIPPYDSKQGYERRMLLARRAADINRDVQPDDQLPD